MTVVKDALLNKVEIEHDERDRRAAGEHGGKHLVEVARVREAGEVVGERRQARVPVEGRVLDGDGGVVREGLHHVELGVREGLVVALVEALVRPFMTSGTQIMVRGAKPVKRSTPA